MSVAKYYVYEMGEALDVVLDRPQRVHSFNARDVYLDGGPQLTVEFNTTCVTLFPSLSARDEQCDCDATICPACWECGPRGEWEHHERCPKPGIWPEEKA